MIWTTELIEEYINDKKSFIRDIKLKSLEDDSIEYKIPLFKDENLRNGNIVFKYTDEELRNILKIKNDIKYFSSFIKINKDIPIAIRGYQEEILDKMKNNRMNLFHVGRQIGFSLLSIIFACNFSITNSEKTILFLSNNSKYTFDNFIKLISFLPFYMKPGIISYKRGSYIKFDNRSKIVFSMYSKFSIGFTPDVTILDDFAFVENKIASSIYKSFLPVILARSDNRLIISSVGSKDVDNVFNNMVKSERIRKSPLNLSVYPNDIHDEYLKEKSFDIKLIEYKCILPDDKEIIRQHKLNQLNIE